VYKILEEAAPESAEVGLQFETRLYGHMAAVSGLILSPEYRQRKRALSTLGFVNMETVLWIRIRIRRISMYFGPPGPASGSVRQRYGFEDLDPYQKVTDPQHCETNHCQDTFMHLQLCNQYRMEVP
jgi:hypothetical protein